MLKKIKSVYEWNEVVGNTEHNLQTTYALTMDELSETMIAIKNKDYKEIVDGICDIMVVFFGEAKKLGIPAEVLSESFDEVMRSNYSKFIQKNGKTTCIKKDGKIQKPEGYKKPDLESAFTDAGYFLITDPVGIETRFAPLKDLEEKDVGAETDEEEVWEYIDKDMGKKYVLDYKFIIKDIIHLPF